MERDNNHVGGACERIKEEFDAREVLINNNINVGEVNNNLQNNFHNESNSWDSGVVFDNVTVVQMAEFQEVVDKFQRQAQPPPPAAAEGPAQTGLESGRESGDQHQTGAGARGGEAQSGAVQSGLEQAQHGLPQAPLAHDRQQSLPVSQDLTGGARHRSSLSVEV